MTSCWQDALTSKERRRNFPRDKWLGDFDFDANPNINPATIHTLATGNPGEVYDEIMTNDDRLTELTGERPRYFRPGTAYMDDVSADIVRSLGLIPVGFTINGDAGATLPAATVTREIARARATDIVIAHGNHPTGGTAPGFSRALSLMKDRGETFLPLHQTSST